MVCKDKVAVVTGAAGDGMGRSIALTLAREGAKVVVNYRNSSEMASSIVDVIVENGGVAVAVQADIQIQSECQRLVDRTIDDYGGIDICVIGPGCGWHMEPAHQLDPSVAVEDVCHEVTPVFNLLPLVLPDMYKRGWGRIIGLGLEPTLSSPAYSYNVAKGARIQSLISAHGEAWKHGVTINVMAPGPVAGLGSLSEAVSLVKHEEEWTDRVKATPQDIAETVSFLCSDMGRFITGCVVPFRER